MRLRWWLTCRVLAGAALVPGCGDGDPSGDRDLVEDHVDSGTRIVARGLASEDGGRFFVSWFDTELDTACQPSALTEDGVTRCVPPEVTEVGYFSDPDCATPVAPLVRQDVEAVAPRFVSEFARDGGRPYYRFYEAGPVTRGAVYELIRFRGCVLHVEDSLYVPVGAPVPADTFVEVSERLGDGGRIVGRTFETSDGARAPAGLAGVRDRELDLDVSPGLDGCDTPRWIPACSADGSEIEMMFADPGCTEPVVMSACGTPAVAQLPDEPCALFEVGAPVDGDVYVRTPNGSCAAAGGGDGLFRVGAPLDLEAFAPVEVGARRGDRLVERLRLDSVGAPVEPRGPIHDDGLDDVPCTFAPASDGVIRCLPADLADGYDPTGYVAADEITL